MYKYVKKIVFNINIIFYFLKINFIEERELKRVYLTYLRLEISLLMVKDIIIDGCFRFILLLMC